MKKKLYRSQTNRVFGGVCGGLAEYLHVNVIIIRIIAFVLLLPGGLPGFILYMILWLVIPLEPTLRKDAAPKHDNVIDV